MIEKINDVTGVVAAAGVKRRYGTGAGGDEPANGSDGLAVSAFAR